MRNARTEALYYALTDIVRNAPKDVRDMQMNLLGTHDTERIITALAADSSKGLSNSELSTMRMTPEQRLRGEGLLMAAYTVISLLPGLSTVFYADEAALEGYSDPFNRMPYPRDPSLAVLEHYKRIGTLRRVLDMLSDADFKLVELTGDRLIFARVKGSAVILTVYNNSDAPDSVEFPRSTTELISGTSARIHTVRPKSASVFKTNAVFLNELTQNL
jgi:glycosidase